MCPVFLQYRHSAYLKRHLFGECDGSPHLKQVCALYCGSGSDLRAACPCGIILFTSAPSGEPSGERSWPVEHSCAALAVAVADSIARAIWKALAKSRSVSDNRRRSTAVSATPQTKRSLRLSSRMSCSVSCTPGFVFPTSQFLARFFNSATTSFIGCPCVRYAE